MRSLLKNLLWEFCNMDCTMNVSVYAWFTIVTAQLLEKARVSVKLFNFLFIFLAFIFRFIILMLPCNTMKFLMHCVLMCLVVISSYFTIGTTSSKIYRCQMHVSNHYTKSYSFVADACAISNIPTQVFDVLLTDDVSILSPEPRTTSVHGIWTSVFIDQSLTILIYYLPRSVFAIFLHSSHRRWWWHSFPSKRNLPSTRTLIYDLSSCSPNEGHDIYLRIISSACFLKCPSQMLHSGIVTASYSTRTVGSVEWFREVQKN